MKLRENGFSLIEVMIGLSLMIGLGLAGSSFFQNQTKAQNSVDRHRQLQNFHASLTSTLQNVANCNATMKDWDGHTRLPSTDIKRLRACPTPPPPAIPVPCPDTTLPAAITTPKLLFTEALANPTDNTQWIDGTRTWQIRDIAAQSINKSGILNLEILYELYPGKENSKRVIKTIPLFVKFSAAGRFVTCSSPSEASISNVVQNICDTLSGDPSSTGREPVAEWNNTTQNCALKSPVKACSSATVPDGITTGMRSVPNNPCKTITRHVDTKLLYNPTPSNCIGGRRPVLRQDASGRLMVNCI